MRCKTGLFVLVMLFTASFVVSAVSDPDQGTGSFGQMGDLPSFMPPQDPDLQWLEPDYGLPPVDTASRTSRASGTADIIVIPIDFQDVVHSGSHDEENLYNRTLSNGTGQNSMRNYYVEVSMGKLDMEGNVTAWVQSAHNMSYYGEDGPSMPDSGNGPIYRLVTEAVLLADPVVDFSEFDKDADGVVDNLFIVHAGQGQEALGGTEDDIWSHHWAVLDADTATPGSQALVVDGVRVYAYSMLSEHSPVGTFAHEYGHELGLPDLYDIDGSSYGIGRWGIMGGGSWNGGGSSPAHMCAWSKMMLGWVDVQDVTGPVEDLAIPQVETTGTVFRLWVGDPSTSTEFFLLENRQKVGYDYRLPGDGLLIWHVDMSRSSNTDDGHRLVDLEEADEENTGDNPTHSSDPWRDSASGFGQYTIPSSHSYGGQPSGWTVRDIGPSEEEMTATIDIIADDVGVSLILFERYVQEGEPVDVEVNVFNFGTNDQEDVEVRMTVTMGSVQVDNITKTIPFIASKTTEVVTLAFTPEEQGNYLVSARTLLEGDQEEANDEMARLLHATTIVFQDDVEGGVNGWVTSSDRPPADLWAIVDDYGSPGWALSPHHSWFCGVQDLAGGGYVPFVDYTLERTVDLADLTDGFLVFSHRYDLAFAIQNRTAPLSDNAIVEVRTNLDIDFEVLATFTGTSGGWTTRIYGIAGLVDRPMVENITIRFRLESQLLSYSKGWWVDDILIVGQWQEHDAAVLFDTDLMSAGPGETKTVGVTVWNSGSVKDTFILTAEAPPYWNASVAAAEIEVEPLKHKALTYTFKVARKATAGEEGELFLHVTSKGDSKVVRKAALTVIVERDYGLDISVPGSRDVVPGDTEVFEVEVINDGNGQESVIFNISGSGAAWATLSVDTLSLGPFETKKVEVVVVLPMMLRAGDTAEVKVKAMSSSGLERTGTINMRFLDVHGLDLVVVLDGVNVTPGGSVDLRFNVTNLGNEKEDIEFFYVLPPGWKVDGDMREVIDAWEAFPVVITVTVPETCPLSEFKVRVMANATYADISEELALKVRVVLPDPAVRSLTLSKTYVTGRENITITVVVANEGTGDAVDIVVGFFDDGENFHTHMIDRLGTGEEVTIEIGHRFGKGRHDVAVVIGYEGAQGSDTNDEAHQDLKVKDDEGFIPGLGALGVAAAVAVPALFSAVTKRMWRRRRR